MKTDAEAQAWAEKVVDGLLEKEDVAGAWRARPTLLRFLHDIADDIARAHRHAIIDLDSMLQAFYEAGGFDGLLRFLSINNPSGATR
ncbi:MAG: hypothetical protein HYT80_03845 [Euryarchaeota archaeon]|nr:hypothetical protein [Euryarchaeota archaeon]